ncbi:DUF5424 family protein [Rickettsia amblyommatis]|uniref:DUF5424 family protein n=1 Tax=Rickettsia amblyommatis TaxID=33989 RepID=UPI0006A7DAC2|nr:DUF5424 family protein [Rickettsia amblyommatis]ALA62305.1 hypothetical protein AL573_07485 [Rickettsia amblyommatis]
MSYNQEGYEFKITQAFNCVNDAIALTYSSVNHFLDIPKVINKYGVLATVALSKTEQLNLTDTKLESIVKNGFIIYEVVETIIKASNAITKDQQLFSKAIDDGINAVNKLQEAAIHLSSVGEPIVEYVTSFFGSHDQHEPLQHEPLLFETYTPNSTSAVIEDYKLIGSNAQLIAVEI